MDNQYNNASLTNCSSCQNLISRQALSCPRCGQPSRPTSYQQPQFQQNFPQPVPKKGGIGRTFGIGCLGLIGFFMIMGIISAVLIPKTNSSTQNQSSKENVITPMASKPPLPQEKVQRGEALVRNANAKYGIDNYLIDGLMSSRINVYLPVNEWRKLSKDDQINVSYYAESLIPLVRANPRKYIVQIPSDAPIYETLKKNASNMCETCWSVEIGSIVKTDAGKNTILGDEDSPVDGANATAFRQTTKKR